MKKAKRFLASLLALSVCLGFFVQGITTASAASYSNGNLQRLAEHINDYGVDDSNGKMLITMKTSGDYDFYYVLRNQTDGIYFNLLISSDNRDRIVSSTEFVLSESSNYISVDFTMLMYNNNQCVDQVYTVKSINKTTYASTSTYSVSGSGTYISASDFSDNFHATLRLLCSYWDEYIYTKLGFGLKAIGFTSYDGYGGAACTSHSYDNSCDATCNNCGAARSVTHSYSGGCDTSCNICGSSRSAGSSHTYDNNKDASCNVCGYTRTIVEEDTSATLYSGTCGSNLTWKITQNGSLIIRGTGNMTSYSSMGSPWFRYVSKIKKIVVEEGVTGIGNNAFYYCTGATSIYLADTVTKLGESSFHNCESVTEIVIPYGVKTLPKFVFDGCTSLETVIIPSTVKTFGQNVFDECSSLQYCIIPDGVATLTYGMFKDCSSLAYIQIPNSVTKVEPYVFQGCGDLSDVYFTGTKSQYNAIDIETFNNGLNYAAVHYNSKAPCVNCTYGGWVKADNSTHQRSCTNCGKTESASHSWNAGTITKQPTCAATGVKTYTCNTCGGTKTEAIAKTDDHSYGSWTKLNDSTHQHSCTLCGKTGSASHSWNAGTITKQPTCAATGVKTYTCSVCSGTKTETLSKTTNHTYGAGTKVDDNSHRHSCTACGKEETAAHIWDAGTMIQAPTLEATGLRQHSCEGCNATKVVVMPKRANGDLNGDQSIDNKDVEYLLWHTLFPGSYPLEIFADFDFNNAVDNKDVEYLLWHTLFPDSYPLYAK